MALGNIFARSNKKILLEIGDHLKNGEVVFDANAHKDTTLRAPKNLLADLKTTFKEQDAAITDMNARNVDGRSDWRRAEDPEADKLATAWDAMAPRNRQGVHAEYYWLSSTFGFNSHYTKSMFGKVRRGGNHAVSDFFHDMDDDRGVAAVRDGVARVSPRELSFKTRLKAMRRPRVQG